MAILLDKTKINSPFPLEIFKTLDSTNNYLLNYSRYDIQICLAETQTSGRGQYDREWHSPSHQNIYFSLKYPIKKIMGLSLVVCLAVIKTLLSFAPDATILAKWPNDIYFQDQKLGGILVEIQHNTHAIIGIGLNINMDHESYASLKKILNSPKEIDRNQICSALITNLIDYIDTFEKTSFENFIPEWNKVDYLAEKEITFQNKTGLMKGINKNGNLLLQLKSGGIQEVISGEPSSTLIK